MRSLDAEARMRRLGGDDAKGIGCQLRETIPDVCPVSLHS